MTQRGTLLAEIMTSRLLFFFGGELNVKMQINHLANTCWIVHSIFLAIMLSKNPNLSILNIAITTTHH